MYRDHEDDLLELQRKPLLEFVREICYGRMSVCTPPDLRDDTLGDERGDEDERGKQGRGGDL